ncbi:MAG: hypothetical protein U9P79_04025 [Candidatus Cloacimonadota bacterium]|nr:hypothetical protein [Candidatus Cloacimonadota bacterium]
MLQPIQNNVAKEKIADANVNNLKEYFSKNNIHYKIEKFSKGLSEDSLSTDIFLALEQIHKKYRGQNLSKIVLLTDGLNHNNNNFDILEEINTPVFPVILGTEVNLTDISIEKIKTNNPIYLNSETEIGISISGLDQRKYIFISMMDDNKILMKEKFDVSGVDDYFVLNYAPTSLGFKKLTIEVELGDSSETNLANNSRDFLLNVVKDKAKILLISSQPNWDISFIHRALNKNPKFKTELIVKRKNGIYFHNNSSVDPSEFISNCDVLILNNSSNFGFPKKIISQIETFVKMGGNLLYINKIDNNLKELLPLVKSKFKQNIDSSILLTEIAENYKTFSIKKNTEMNSKFWRNLPPISTYFYTQKKNTEIIAQADLATENPIIAFSSYFKGHVLMLAGNGFYRWKMWEDSTSPWFDNFIISLADWLINSNINKRFICSTDKMQYLEGQTVNFSSMVFDERMNLLPNVDIFLTLKQGNEKINQMYFTENEYEYSAVIKNLPVGKYEFLAECKIGNQLNHYSGEFIIDPMSLEQSSTGINTNILSFIASQTNGSLIENVSSTTGADSDDFDKITLEKSKSLQVSSANEFELWKKWYIPFLAILFFSIELLIRKRKGLL